MKLVLKLLASLMVSSVVVELRRVQEPLIAFDEIQPHGPEIPVEVMFPECVTCSVDGIDVLSHHECICSYSAQRATCGKASSSSVKGELSAKTIMCVLYGEITEASRVIQCANF
jgi:hypothetical protein